MPMTTATNNYTHPSLSLPLHHFLSFLLSLPSLPPSILIWNRIAFLVFNNGRRSHQTSERNPNPIIYLYAMQFDYNNNNNNNRSASIYLYLY